MSDEETGALLRALPVTEARVRVIAGAVVLDVPGHGVALAFTPETARGVANSLVRFADQAGGRPQKESAMESTTMDDVKFEAYEQPAAGWAGCVSAKDGSWIVWVGTDGRASLYDTRGDTATCVGTVERKAMTT